MNQSISLALSQFSMRREATDKVASWITSFYYLRTTKAFIACGCAACSSNGKILFQFNALENWIINYFIQNSLVIHSASSFSVCSCFVCWFQLRRLFKREINHVQITFLRFIYYSRKKWICLEAEIPKTKSREQDSCSINQEVTWTLNIS